MAYRQLPGQADGPRERPEAVQPVPEHYEGVNFPYRGTEQHGVAVPEGTEFNTREFQYKEEDPEEYAEPLPEPEPIPVRVVTNHSRERLAFRSARYRVTDQAEQLVGRHEHRRGIRIKVHWQTDAVDSNPVWIGHDDGVKPYTGYQLDRGEVVDGIMSTEPIYAVCNPGESVEVSVMYTYAVEL